MYLNRDQVDLAALQEKLVGLRLDDPDINVVIRGSQRRSIKTLWRWYGCITAGQCWQSQLATEAFADGAAKKE